MRRKGSLAAAFWLVALVLAAGVPARAAGQPINKQALARTLRDTALWGKDLPVALGALGAFRRQGVAEVDMYRDRIVARGRAGSTQDAKKAADALDAALAQPPPKWTSEFAALAQRVPAKLPLQAQVVGRYDDDLPHVAASGRGLLFLAPGLTIATVRQRLGPPEQVTTIAIQGIGERRPVVLTIHSYLGGTLKFAESNRAPKPGLVDRVIIEVSGIGAALFQERP